MTGVAKLSAPLGARWEITRSWHAPTTVTIRCGNNAVSIDWLAAFPSSISFPALLPSHLCPPRSHRPSVMQRGALCMLLLAARTSTFWGRRKYSYCQDFLMWHGENIPCLDVCFWRWQNKYLLPGLQATVGTDTRKRESEREGEREREQSGKRYKKNKLLICRLVVSYISTARMLSI